MVFELSLRVKGLIRMEEKPIKYPVLLEGYSDEERTYQLVNKLKGKAEESLHEYTASNPNAD